jgi:membrane protein required for colicin V production
MNTFDVVVCTLTLVTAIIGFNAGFIRSMASILGYVAAAPLAVGITSMISSGLAPSAQPTALYSFVFGGIFLAIGFVVGWLLRFSVDEAVGPARSIPDRLAGCVLGAVRIGLVAITLVLVFDRVIPAGRDPDYLIGSKLRPILSDLGKRGLKTLPPETTAYIDKLKRG